MHVVLAPIEALLAAPAALFLVALTVFLFRPPDLDFYSIDRIVFCLLIFVVLLRLSTLRQSLSTWGGLAWPMIGLSVLSVASALSHPFEARAWSVLAAKFIVPFAMFWLAGLVFQTEGSLRWLQRFFIAVLAYLSFTAITFLVGAHELVFPRFILDESLGIHADRARGPFLQAVANGVTLNMLGLLALDRYRRRELRGVWALTLLASLPVAILATKTRAIWLSFAASVGFLVLRFSDRRLRRACMALTVAGALALFGVLELGDNGRAMNDRLQESSAVRFRIAVYRAGWEMFLERPLMGWGTRDLQAELAGRTYGFEGEVFAVHNTYLDVLLEHGAVGLSLYVWLLAALLRLRKASHRADVAAVASIRELWPLLLSVYLVNAMFVVMNYQFVNSLLFTLAGVLAARTANDTGANDAGD